MRRISKQFLIGIVSEVPYVFRKLAIARPWTSDWRDASALRAAARAQILEGFASERVQTPLDGVFFNPAVPRVSVKFGKPSPEKGEFGDGEFEYSLLDLFYTSPLAYFQLLRTHNLPTTRGASARPGLARPDVAT
jgi:hypothetical protein